MRPSFWQETKFHTILFAKEWVVTLFKYITVSCYDATLIGESHLHGAEGVGGVPVEGLDAVRDWLQGKVLRTNEAVHCGQLPKSV